MAYDALGYATTYQYDASLNLTTVTDALGNISSMVYDGSRRMTVRIDPLGRRTTYAWNSDGTLQSMQDGRGLLTTNAYDACGNLASILQSDGSVITYGYDSLSRRTSSQMPGDTVARSIVYDTAADHVIATVDLNGARSTSVYDACLLVASVNPLNERTTLHLQPLAEPQETVMNPLGFVSTWVYDTMNRPTGAINALGYRTNDSITVATGRRWRTWTRWGISPRTSMTPPTAPAPCGSAGQPAGPMCTTRESLSRAWIPWQPVRLSIYDKVNRQIASVSPLGYRSTSTLDAAGRLSASIARSGGWAACQYDAVGRRTVVQEYQQQTDHDGILLGPQPAGIGDGPQWGSRPRTPRPAVRSCRRAMRTAATSRTSTTAMAACSLYKTNLGKTPSQYGYDLAGRVVTMADAANSVRSYACDVAGRNTATPFPDGTIATFGYDAEIGQRTTMSDWGGVSTYAYDPRSQMSGKTDPASVQAYNYDPVGKCTTLTLSGTGTFTSTFDSLNRPSVSQKPDGLLYTMQYDADSRRTTMLLGQGSRKQAVV